MRREKRRCLLCSWSDANHAIKLDARLVGQYALDECFCICGECIMVRQGVDRETLIVIGEENADQFAHAAIALESCPDGLMCDFATKVCHHKGDAAIFII